LGKVDFLAKVNICAKHDVFAIFFTKIDIFAKVYVSGLMENASCAGFLDANFHALPLSIGGFTLSLRLVA
jgi:hypothetical protein